MRDRLTELGGVATKVHSEEEEQVDSGEDVDNGEFEQHAVVFEGEDIMEDTFREAQSIQKEISQLRMEVKRLENNQCPVPALDGCHCKKAF
ncbi:hypothetical protein PO909_011392 [Leuciscus waleckii]